MDPTQPDQTTSAALRDLPAVDHLLRQPSLVKLLEDYPRSEVVRVVRLVLDECRAALRAGRPVNVDPRSLGLEVRQRLFERSRPRLRRVINATGIVLHTGLGRAPLAEEALNAIVETAAGYCNLELDLDTGQRGSRHDHVRGLLRELTGAADSFVVNNNAAATYLALNTCAAGREVLISRGQLVEIGGSYRLPDIMRAAGCHMIEVGTTNRTRLGDYEKALSEKTAVLLHVHTSNYRIRGFTESTAVAELVQLARLHNLLVIDDLGSGLLTADMPGPEEAGGEPGAAAAPDGRSLALPLTWDEPTIRGSVAAGADLTLFSGDKLLGGPQAGIVLGRSDLIADLQKNPLARALRPGKLTFAALEATLRLYRDPASLVQRVPAYRLLARRPAELEALARRLAEQIVAALPAADVAAAADVSEAGGGTLPDQPFPTWVVRVRPTGASAAVVAAELRRRSLPVICRIADEALVFDVRTVEPDDLEQIPGALSEIAREAAG